MKKKIQKIINTVYDDEQYKIHLKIIYNRLQFFFIFFFKKKEAGGNTRWSFFFYSSKKRGKNPLSVKLIMPKVTGMK